MKNLVHVSSGLALSIYNSAKKDVIALRKLKIIGINPLKKQDALMEWLVITFFFFVTRYTDLGESGKEFLDFLRGSILACLFIEKSSDSFERSIYANWFVDRVEEYVKLELVDDFTISLARLSTCFLKKVNRKNATNARHMAIVGTLIKDKMLYTKRMIEEIKAELL